MPKLTLNLLKFGTPSINFSQYARNCRRNIEFLFSYMVRPPNKERTFIFKFPKD